MKFSKTYILFVLAFTLLSSTYAQSSLKKANKQYELFAFNLAAKSYLKVLEKNTSNAEAMWKLADCYRHLNQMEEAVTWYDRAINQPKSRDLDEVVYLQFGKALKTLGRYEEAKRWFLMYAEKFPVEGTQFAESCNFAQARQSDPPLFEVIPEFANTTSSDFGPTIFKPGKIAYASSRTDIQASTRNRKSSGISNNRLFITNRHTNDFWQTPTLLRESLGNTSNEGPIAYSPDGRWVAITKNNFVESTRQIPSSGLELSLYIAEVQGDGDWSNATPFPYNGSGYSTGFPSFSPDGNQLFFASDRPDGFGGFDIYVSKKIGSSWSAPVNLGGMINSQGNELTPFYNGRDLYFASDWHAGFGGLDIFKAEQVNGSWNNISHGGTGLNSSRDDYGLVFEQDGSFGYFVSNRFGGKGNEDIYRVTGGNGGSIGGSSNVVIRVLNSSTGEPIANAEIDMTRCGGSTSAFTNGNGAFSFNLKDDSCNPSISKPGYIRKSIIINSLTLNEDRTVEVQLTKEGEIYTGTIVNAAGGYVLEDVNVRATNTTTNQRIEAFSDRNGKYSLGLQTGGTFIIRYSLAGFKDLNKTVRTNDGLNKMIETVELVPSGTNIGLGTISNNQTSSTGNANTSNSFNTGGATTSTGTDVGNQSTTNNNTTTTHSSSTNNTTSVVTREGYAVQIAALGASQIDLSSYSRKVGRLGTVFLHQEDGKSKIRVGPFTSRSEANDAKNQLRAKGYNGAFVVTQTIKETVTNNTDRNTTNPVINDKPSTPTTITRNTITTNFTDLEGYIVRLAAYKNEQFFDRNKVIDIGVIKSMESNGYLVMLLTGFDTKDMAERALRKAKARGFRDAYLVQEMNGELVKVR